MKPPPSYAPVYSAALYPELAVLFREHGYALAVHGSLQRDFDLVAIPWVDEPSPILTVLEDVETKFSARRVGEPGVKKHGRVAYTLSLGFGNCALDLSFMPFVIPSDFPTGVSL